MSNIAQRLKRLEAMQPPEQKPFYDLCIEWKLHPERRPGLSEAAGMSIAAADLLFQTGLKYGPEAGKGTTPFQHWETAEIRAVLALCDG